MYNINYLKRPSAITELTVIKEGINTVLQYKKLTFPAYLNRIYLRKEDSKTNLESLWYILTFVCKIHQIYPKGNGKVLLNIPGSNYMYFYVIKSTCMYEVWFDLCLRFMGYFLR